MKTATDMENESTNEEISHGSLNAKTERSKGTSALLNFWLDVCLLVAVAFVGWVTAVLQFVFPPPTSADEWRLWGFSYNQWHNTQFIAIAITALLLIEHIVLHWKWVCNVIATKVLRSKTRPDEAQQAVYGVGAFVVLLTIILSGILIAMFSVKRPTP